MTIIVVSLEYTFLEIDNIFIGSEIRSSNSSSLSRVRYYLIGDDQW